MLPPEIIEQIRDGNPLEQYLARDVTLKKTGASYKACCPFHNERTPSFTVYPDQNRYFCFGCGKKGDIFTYVQEREGLNFMDAAKKLAADIGLDLGPYLQGQGESEKFANLYQVNEAALQIFTHNLTVLPDGKKAMEYLLRRGLKPATIDHFRIGYARMQWDTLSTQLEAQHFNRETLFDAGLARLSREGARVYDYFRNRVMFPIFNQSNKVIAFGGRVMPDDDGPKYLNTAETPVFKKRNVLYGFNFAKSTITKGNVVYLVEGYLDVIGLHQAGFSAAVAPLGTGLTEDHVGLLRKYTDRIVFMFDGDGAGRKAVFQNARAVLDLGFKAKVVAFGEKEDAFDIAVSAPKKKIADTIRQGMSLTDYVLNYLAEGKNLQDINEKITYLRSVYAFLDGFDEHVTASLMVKNAAVLCGVSIEDALTDFANFQKRADTKPSVVSSKVKQDVPADAGKEIPVADFEWYLLRLVTLNPEAWQVFIDEIEKGLILESGRALALFNHLQQYLLENSSYDPEDILECINDQEIRAQLVADMQQGHFYKDWERQFEDTVRKLRIRQIRNERRLISAEIQRLTLSGSNDEAERLQKRFLELRKAEEELK